jgi:polyhydroxybutyrate depolymerase
MKRSALFAVIGPVLLLATNCSENGQSSGQGSGGNGGAKTVTGGSSSTNDSGGSGGNGSGGTTTSTTKRDAAAFGGQSGSGGSGGTISTTKHDAAISDGDSGKGGSGGASTGKGGATGSGGAKGGTTGTAGPGTGGKTGTGGAVGTGGAIGIDGGTIDGGMAGSAPSAGCGKATTLTSARASIDVSGKTREYILALPKTYDQNHPYKLVFVWHPWGGSAQQIASGGYFGLQKVANNEAIFVAGEGQDYQNNGLGWGNAGGEDFDFLQAMLERFRSQLCIDENRIFSTGFSFGAMFSFTLGCEADSMMRAIVPMAGNTTTSGGCAAGTRQVAVLALIGTDDTLLSGHRQAVETYAKRDGCTTQTAPAQPSWCDGIDQKYLPCTCVSYQGCKSGYPVVSCEYKAGHQQAPNPGPIWDFLSQF